MQEDIRSHIQQSLLSFTKFIYIQQARNWINTANTEEIKAAFKLSVFIEKSLQQLEAQNITPNFLSILKANNQIATDVSKETFELAGDKVLSLIFEGTSFNENRIDNAVRIYTSLYSQLRLENWIKNYLLQTSSYEAIQEFTFVNRRSINVDDLKVKLYLKRITSEYKISPDETRQCLKEMFSAYNVEYKLDLLIGILALKNVNDDEECVRNYVLELVLTKMLDRSIISKHFWLTLFKIVTHEHIANACMNYETFLESLWKFILYVGSMMESTTIGDHTVWASNQNISICPEITFTNIVSILKSLHRQHQNIAQYIDLKLVEAAVSTNNSSLWLKLKGEINDSYR